MTAPTTNGHRGIGGLLRKTSDGPGHPGEFGAYPKDPYPTLDVDEVTTPEAPAKPDLNADDTGTPPLARYEILPPWMKTTGGIRRNLGHNTPILANRLAYLAVKRGYAVRPIGWACRGAGRLVVELAHFAVDIETLRMQRDAARRGDGRARSYERKERHKTRRSRAGWTLAAIAAAGVAVRVLTAPNLPVLVRLALWVGTIAGLAHIGRPGTTDGTTGVLRPDQNQDPAKSTVRTERVVAVFHHAGIDGVMTFGGTRRRDHGAKGWEAVVDLPDGTTVDEILKVHTKLCSGWKVQKERLYLQRAGHEGQVHMTLFDQDPMTADPVRTPLRDLKPRSLWDPVPVGTTAYGDPYGLVLPGTSGLWVCSAPGYGKTNFLLLILAAAAALGIRVRIFIHDGKGEGDLEVYRDLADHFSQGSNDTAGRACLKMLTEVRDLQRSRANLIRRVRAERPELMQGPQITRAVTEDPQWDLPLILVLVDEFNLMVKTGSGDDIQKETMGIAEGCRSGGIIPVVAGQNFKADVLGGAQSSMGTRVAFKTNSPADSNTILGQGQVGDGFNTSRWPDNYQGVAIVRPAGKQVQSGTHQVKMHLGEYADHVAIAAHAGRQRIAAGGVTLTKRDDNLLARVLQAMGSENVVAVDELADRLGIDVEAMVADLRELGVPVEKSRGHGNRRAVRRRDVLDRM